MTHKDHQGSVGRPVPRIDGWAKALGNAPYAFESGPEAALHLHPVAASVPRGRVTRFDSQRAEGVEGVRLVLSHHNAPRLFFHGNHELFVLQSASVHFRNQYVGAVVAETSEAAREAAALVEVDIEPLPHDVLLEEKYPGSTADPAPGTDVRTTTEFSAGDVEAALEDAAVTVDRTYRTPMVHNHPLEPHTTVALWRGATQTPVLTLYDSSQGPFPIRDMLAPVLGLDPEQVRVVCPYVGGGFGSKYAPHAHHVLIAMAARVMEGRPVKVALTRQQMFTQVGYRSPTIQRLRLGADRDGRLLAISHEATEQTARYTPYAVRTAIGTRTMYQAEHRRVTHRLVPVDLSLPTTMRAPSEAPWMFALESAMDELACALGQDPVELRVLNEPHRDPESGLPYSSRNQVRCLREGARRFGWERRPPGTGGKREGDWLIGQGVAAATYPAYPVPPGSSTAVVRAQAAGRYLVLIGACDIGTGSRTALTQIAADALEVAFDCVDVVIGDSSLPRAVSARASMGLSAWGSTIVAAARAFRDRHGPAPREGAEASAGTPENMSVGRYAMHAFGAQFAETRVHIETGEVRVPRLLGVFAVGRVVNPATARSQLVGGMTMGLSLALCEESVVDPRYGHVVNNDFTAYPIATHADAPRVEAYWIDEDDPHFNPMGAKGIGEIGIVGITPVIANAVFDATGVRVREVPVTPDKMVR
ncbi:xanthine dehydrogenase family protein molybdopterin-binding subunit [Streptomyces sp. NPDC047108]|uniref:xanthine dehydrogenase family protein molybdopterin-binding subunit n=1 Tax=Streptomyces sp. NPDC047108 TaxID=3155025 RepID=UPI0033D758B4